MGLPEITALVTLFGLIVYALTGGADFGGGVWDLLASGPRAADQRRLIERAIAPIWEANHVWLVFVVVMLFAGFPLAYAVASVALHLPLTAMLLGIVLRGSAFVFRQYGEAGERARRNWGRVFSVSSLITPLFLGMTLAAVTGGELRVTGGRPEGGFFVGWVGAFPLAVGVLTVVAFAYLAAVYLTVEADDAAVREDFRARALIAGVALAPCAAATALLAGPGTSRFAAALFGSSWSLPLQLATGVAATGALFCLWTRRFRLARLAAAAQITLILGGWALAQRPYLIAPDVTIRDAAAPTVTLELLVAIGGGGSVLLLPSLYFLYRVFRKVR
jgi:cytochrome d ubiquinol oxidase subunit II